MGLEIMRALSNSERVWRLTQRTITCPKSVPDESPSVFSPLGRAMRWMFANDEYKDLVAYVMVAEPGSAEESFACPVMLDDIPRLFRTCSFKEPIASLLQLHEQWERIWSAHVWNGANHRWDIGHNSVLATVLPTLWLLAREYARRESSPSEVVEQEPYVHQDYEYPTFCGHGVWPKSLGLRATPCTSTSRILETSRRSRIECAGAACSTFGTLSTCSSAASGRALFPLMWSMPRFLPSGSEYHTRYRASAFFASASWSKSLRRLRRRTTSTRRATSTVEWASGPSSALGFAAGQRCERGGAPPMASSRGWLKRFQS